MTKRELIIVSGAVLIGAAFLSVFAAAKEPDAAQYAAEAAEIGDVVIIRYTNGTILCEDPADADKVYIAGENALRESMRVDRTNITKAIEAKVAARDSAMRQARNCQRSPTPRDLRYIVKDKAIAGSDKDVFYVAKYCLKPVNRTDDTCWWIEATANESPQIIRSKP